jgi:hypothetical protein
VKEHDTRLWHRPSLGRGCARADFASVKRVAIDETAARRGHGYVTLFVGIDQRRVLSVADGRDANTVAAFADDLEAHKGDASRIKEVCIDMSGAFIKGVDYNLTEAEITFDEFHAVKLVNDAVDKVRCAESKDRPELKRSRYLWLKNERHLSAEQSANLNALSSMHLKTARARFQATHVKQRRAKKSGLPVGKSSAYSSRNQRAYCDDGRSPTVATATGSAITDKDGLVAFTVNAADLDDLKGIIDPVTNAPMVKAPLDRQYGSTILITIPNPLRRSNIEQLELCVRVLPKIALERIPAPISYSKDIEPYLGYHQRFFPWLHTRHSGSGYRRFFGYWQFGVGGESYR